MTPLTDAVRERLTDEAVHEIWWGAAFGSVGDGIVTTIKADAIRDGILAAIAPVLEQAQRELREMTESRDTHRRNETALLQEANADLVQIVRQIEVQRKRAEKAEQAQGAQTPTCGMPLRHWCDACEAVTFHECRGAAPADPGGGS